MFSNLLNLLATIFLLMLVGVLLRKLNIITDSGKKSLTSLVINVILPCNIIKAFCQDLGGNIWQTFFVLLLASILIQLGCLFLSKLLYGRLPDDERAVLQYATICSNAGFMGNPIAQGVFGDMGLLYASIFLIPQRIVMWSAGISAFEKNSNGKSGFRKVLLHPCIVAVYIGVFFMLTGFRLPGALNNILSSLSSCNTALSMMIVGTILYEINPKSLCSKKVLAYSVLRLVFIPLLVFGCCRLAKVSSLITGVCVLLTAMPAGTTTSILAAKYNGNEQLATKCVVVSTALSIISLTIWSYILLLLS